MTFRLLPKDVKFFGLFIEDGANLELAGARLREMVDKFDRLDEARGRSSLKRTRDPSAFERGNYIRTLHSWIRA